MLLDGCIKHFGVYLCGFRVRVAQHAAYEFDGDVVGQGHGGGKGMACDVAGEWLVYSGNLPKHAQKTVIGLVAEHGQLSVITFQYAPCRG